jgi:hypothetical protein
MTAPPEEQGTGHLDERLAAIPGRHPAVGLAVGVVRDGRLCRFYGHGFADIVSGTPVTQDTVFRTWAGICGWYSFRGSLRDAQKWLVAGAEVFVRRGQLTLRPVTPVPALARGLPLHPDDPGDPYVFRIDLSSLGLGISRVVFSRSSHAAVTAFHLDLDVALLSFDKQSAARDPRYWAGGVVGVVAAAGTANAVRRHRQYAPLRARGRALAAAAAPARRHDVPHQGPWA